MLDVCEPADNVDEQDGKAMGADVDDDFGGDVETKFEIINEVNVGLDFMTFGRIMFPEFPDNDVPLRSRSTLFLILMFVLLSFSSINSSAGIILMFLGGGSFVVIGEASLDFEFKSMSVI